MTTVHPSGHAVHRVVNLIPDSDQSILNMTVDDARNRMLSDDPASVLGIHGAFALVTQDGERVCLARSLNRPLRYFLAKEAAGPLLVVSDRIDTIHRFLVSEGYADQFHPTYTRMAPAHHVTEIQLIGCPDPNPTYRRFFTPPMGTLPPDLDTIGQRYVEAVLAELREWLSRIPDTEALGVAFSGGLDSGTILLCVHDALRQLGQSPARLKAFTLSVGNGGDDARNARAFLRQTGLEFMAEEISVSADAVDPLAASRIIEDYKPLDVQSATMALASCREIRRRYPDWLYLVDGDGGDENLKDYPIEENPDVVDRIEAAADPEIIEELRQTFPDFVRACDQGALVPEAFRSYGPVVRFQNSLLNGFATVIGEIQARQGN